MDQALAVGAPVAIVLGCFKIIELLVNKVGNGSGPMTKDQAKQIMDSLHESDKMLVRIAERLQVSAQYMDLLVKDQEKLAKAMTEHEAQARGWIERGCPNAEPTRELLHKIDMLAERIKGGK